MNLEKNFNSEKLKKNKEVRSEDRIMKAKDEHIKRMAEKRNISVDEIKKEIEENLNSKVSVEVAGEDGAKNLEETIKMKWEKRSAQKDAKIDALTKIPNRLGFERYAEKLIELIKSGRLIKEHERKNEVKEFWILGVDFDNFKKINDAYGHAAGDVVLKTVAALISEHIRPFNDMVARIGGDEFSVIIKDGGSNAPVIAERLRREINNAHIEYEGKRLPVSVTIGASPYLDDNLGEMMRVADNALYVAKGEKDKVEKEGLEIEGDIPVGDDVKNQVWYYDDETKKYRKYKAEK